MMLRGYRLVLVSSFLFLAGLIFGLQEVNAQWPPFYLSLNPVYEAGKITYDFRFYSKVEWSMTDIAIKVKLPEGTRFVETNSIPGITSTFDGKEVTIFTPSSNNSIRWGDVSFVVEVTDPTRTEFVTQAWISWQGENPGDYLTGDIFVDITKQPLIWEAPPSSRLQLEAGAVVTDNIIIYTIYPKNVTSSGYTRMQDLKINIPIPPGTTFLSAEVNNSPFVSHFDGQEVSFSILELERGVEVNPLNFMVSTKVVTTPFVITHAWAQWKNVGVKVGNTVVSQEETLTGDIIVRPGVAQNVVADVRGDVPFGNYDITTVALQEDGPTLKISFYLAESIALIDEYLEFDFYIDGDCQADTDEDYRVRYRHDRRQSVVYYRDKKQYKWVNSIRVNNQINENIIDIWLPYNLLQDDTHKEFCWRAEARNRTNLYNPSPPRDYVARNANFRLKQYKPVSDVNIADSTLSLEAFVEVGAEWQYLPGWAKPPADWISIDFDDSNWFSGPTDIGYGDKSYATNLSDIVSPFDSSVLVERTITQTGVTLAVLPSGEKESVFMRHRFTVTNPTSITQLTMDIDYQGGFVAYLNGTEVARRGLGEPKSSVSFNTLAAAQEKPLSETIDLSEYITYLNTGDNVLAVQSHKSLNSSGFFISPSLIWNNYPWNKVVNTTPTISNTLVTEEIATNSTDLSGKLAVPLDNGRVAYDVYVFALPDGRELIKIPNARQPNFRFDGQRMLINREGGGVENAFEYNLADGTEKQVSDAPQDWHPFYDPWGNRVVYGNSELTVGARIPLLNEKGEEVRDDYGQTIYHSPRQPFIFVQCGLLPPHLETEPRCRNIPWLGVLVPAGQTGEIQGTHPVWTANDMIAYRGCNTWVGSSLCGIYIVPSSSTKGFSNGFIPKQLTRESSDTPSDTKGNRIAFTSQRDGNFEAYIMDLNGDGIKNLSNNPGSNDGLPTISPDGNWVAFISDRDGRWAIWVVPVGGGSPQKLFNLPVDVPWGDGDRVWMNERISWGP